MIFCLKLFSERVRYLFVDLAGGVSDFETAFAAKTFFSLLGGLGTSRFLKMKSLVSLDFNSLFLFSTALSQLAKLPSFCLFIGTNPRFESPLLNFRFTQLYASFATPFYRIGGSANYSSYPIRILSHSLNTFFLLSEFKHVFCRSLYLNSFVVQPFILVSYSALLSAGVSAFLAALLSFGERASCLSSIFFPLKSDNFACLTSLGSMSSFAETSFFSVITPYSS